MARRLKAELMLTLPDVLRNAAKKTLKQALIQFLRSHPNPDDKTFHAWAESQGVEHSQAEQVAYELATSFVSKQGNKKPIRDEKVYRELAQWARHTPIREGDVVEFEGYSYELFPSTHSYRELDPEDIEESLRK